MPKLNILHLSDLHHQGLTAADQQIVVQALKRDISKLKETLKIDFLIFSGDLVQSGSNEANFKNAMTDIVDPILNELSLDNTQLCLCPGNHDIDRDIVRNNDYIEAGLRETLKTRDSINSFIDKHLSLDISSRKLPEAFSRMKNFFKAVWQPMAASGAVVTPFFAIRKIKIDGLQVAVCIFNSAWRCTGEGGDHDKGKLIIGERAIDNAVTQTQDAAIRIAVFHHPFDWLTEADRTAVETRLHSDFHAFFYGHVHAALPTFTRSPMGGAVYSQAGCLYSSRDYFNGYSIVEIDTNESSVTITAREYSDRIREFTPAVGALPEGKVSFNFPFLQGAGGSNLMALLATVRPEIKRLGNDHVKLASDDTVEIDLEQHFICPPLSRPKRVAEDDITSDNNEESETLTITDILETDKNVLILGPSESGKTSVIHYAALKAVTDPLEVPRLPLRAKFDDFKKGNNSIWRAVRPYANEISDGKITSRIVADVPIILFVDEVSLADDQQLEFVLSLASQTTNIKWILVADGNGQKNLASKENNDRLDGFMTVLLNELSRSSIRALSAQWLGKDINTEVANSVFNKVMEHISRSGLPRSGYIVSLILWTLRRGLSGDRINEAVLLENIIEYMLQKMDYRDSLRSDFDFTSKVAVLQELAIFFRSTTGSVTKNEVVAKVIDYLRQKGLKYDGGKIVNGFIECGLFVEIDDTVEFRYRRFEEFFTAGYLRDNRTAYDIAIAVPGWKGYAREMDIYTSRYRNETSLLNVGFDKIQKLNIPVPQLDGDNLQKYLAVGGNVTIAHKRLKKMKKEPMSARKIDEFRDKADASLTSRRTALSQAKESNEEKISNAVLFISSLEVYTNFIRNIEFADSIDKVQHLNHCFDLWELQAKFILSALQEAFVEVCDEIQTDPDISDDIRGDILQVAKDIEGQVKYFVPRLISSELYQNLGTEKLSHLIEDIANNLDNSKLKRVLASFVLLEIDAQKAMDLMSSTRWHQTMGESWIDGMVEIKIYQYYLEQHLTGEVRKKFEVFVATLEARLGNTKFHGDRIKGARIQRMERNALISDFNERRKNK